MTAESCLFCNVCELALAIVSIETVPEGGSAFVRLVSCFHGIAKGRAIDEEEVQIPVAIVVEYSNPTGHGFDEVLLRSKTGLVFEGDTGTDGLVSENGQRACIRSQSMEGQRA
jgi:hypothetical protein